MNMVLLASSFVKTKPRVGDEWDCPIKRWLDRFQCGLAVLQDAPIQRMGASNEAERISNVLYKIGVVSQVSGWPCPGSN